MSTRSKHPMVCGTVLALLALGGGEAQAQPAFGPVFQVNSTTATIQLLADVDAAPNGDFLVVWWNLDGEESSSILAQRFDVTSSPSGSEFQVNTITTGIQRYPSLAINQAGDAIVVWNNDQSVAGQRYDAAGAPLGSEFVISAAANGSFIAPKVAVDGAGAAVVTWDSLVSSGTDSDGRSIQARRYDASGNPIGSNFQVNTTTTGTQRVPDISTASNGSTVIVWSDYATFRARGQRYDSAGNATGGEFLVGDGYKPLVAHDATDSFVVAWDTGYNGPISTRRYDASGAPVGSSFDASGTGIEVVLQGIAFAPTGNFSVIWTENNQSVLVGQRFTQADTPLGSEFAVGAYAGPNGYASASIAIDQDGRVVVVWDDFDDILARRAGLVTLPSLGALGLLGLAALALVAGVRSLHARRGSA